MLTNQPRGSIDHFPVQGIATVTQSATNHATNNDGLRIFNFGNCGDYCYITPNNANTVEHWVEVTLEEPRKFERMLNVGCLNQWARHSPGVLERWNDSEQGWEPIAKFGGKGLYYATKPNGDNHHLQCYEIVPIDLKEAIGKFRLRFPAKAAVPNFNADAYISLRTAPHGLTTYSACHWLACKWYGLPTALLLPLALDAFLFLCSCMFRPTSAAK